MKWQVIAPDKERVILCEGYIRHELRHGSYVNSNTLPKLFPEFFIQIYEPPKEKKVAKVPVSEKTTSDKPSSSVVKKKKVNLSGVLKKKK